MQCDNLQPRRKSVAIITSTMAHIFRAEMLSHFSSLLADRGWDITIITHNRQGFFDFLVEERVHRFSMDAAYHKDSQRQEILAKFVEDHPEIDQYLFWDVRMKTFCDDFDTIQKMGKMAIVSFWDSLNEIAPYGAGKRDEIMKRAAMAAASVSSLPMDSYTHGVTYIPYLFPFAKGDLSQAELGNRDLVLFTTGWADWTVAVAKCFAQLVKEDASFKDKKLRIVPVDEELAPADRGALQKVAKKCPENIILEEFCEKPHKIMAGNAGVIVVNRNQAFPRVLSVAIAKGVPALAIKGYDDYGIQGLKEGYRVCRADSEKLQAEIKAFFDAKANAQRAEAALDSVNAENQGKLVSQWEKVLLGEAVEEYEFASREQFLESCVSYLKNTEEATHRRYGGASLFNGTWLVKRAKKKAAAMETRGIRYPFTRAARWLYRKLVALGEAYKRWERNTFLWRSYIDTPMATRKKVQMLILKIFIEFDRICRENGLRYYLAGGTLLGAVRHKGFIPWDDDLDVTMPRKDYDKFLKICPSKLREGFCLNAHAYPYTFTRLEVLGPRTTAPLQRNGRNIFVDILPLDCACPDENKKEKHFARSEKLRWAMMDEAKLLFPIKKDNVFAVIRRAFRKVFCPYSIMIKKWTKNATKYQSDDATHWVCLPGDYGYDGESFPVEYWGEPVMMEFEGLTVPGMNQWEVYLTEHYGDYMQYPPLSDRSLKHKIYSLDFGPYEKKSVEEIAQEVSDDYFASTGKRISFLKD